MKPDYEFERAVANDNQLTLRRARAAAERGARRLDEWQTPEGSR
jgi:hypothetical protein